MTFADPAVGRAALVVARVGVAAATLMVLVSTWAVLTPASAAIQAGTAAVVTPTSSTGGGGDLPAGGSDTDFTLRLPAGAACSGDSANGGYRIQSYMVGETVDPATLRFGANGPTPAGAGRNYRQPLYTVDGNPYVHAQTANADPAPGPGPILDVPSFDFAVWGPGDIPAGSYNLGLACTLGPASSSTQLDRYWNVRLTFTTDASDTPAQVTWAVDDEPEPSTTTSSSTSTSTSTSTSSTTTSTSTSTSTTSTSTTSTSTTSTSTTSTSTTSTVPTSTSTSTSTSTTMPDSPSTSTTSTSTTAPPTPTGQPVGLSVTSGPPGTVTAVEGRGFRAGTLARILLFSDPVLLASTPADADGVVRATVAVPSVAPGVHRVEIQGVAADGSARVISGPFTVTGLATGADGGASATTSSTAALPRTGRPVVPLLLSGFLLVLFGRITVLLSRGPIGERRQ